MIEVCCKRRGQEVDVIKAIKQEQKHIQGVREEYSYGRSAASTRFGASRTGRTRTRCLLLSHQNFGMVYGIENKMRKYENFIRS